MNVLPYNTKLFCVCVCVCVCVCLCVCKIVWFTLREISPFNLINVILIAKSRSAWILFKEQGYCSKNIYYMCNLKPNIHSPWCNKITMLISKGANSAAMLISIRVHTEFKT